MGGTVVPCVSGSLSDPPPSDAVEAVAAAGPSRRVAQLVDRRRVAVSVSRAVAGIVLILVVYFVAPLEADRWGSPGLRALIAFVLLIAAIVFETLAVMRSASPALRAGEALGVSVSLVLAVAASGYLAISTSDPEAFTEPLDHVGALYLAMMTLTTVGFGDIGTQSSGARIAVMVQMVVNIVVLGAAVKIVFGAARGGGRRLVQERSTTTTESSG